MKPLVPHDEVALRMTGTGAAHPGSRRLVAWVRAHPVGAFLAWFFPVGWAIVFVPVLARQALSIELPLEPFLIASTWLALLLPPIVLTRLIDGPTGLDALRRRLLPTRASIGWCALALLAVPLIAMALAIIVYGPPPVTPSVLVSALVNGLLLQTAFGFIAVNLWEETAWMGFVQPRLQVCHGATVVTAGLFTLQHVPLFVENAAGLIILVVFFVAAIPFRALLAWVYNRTGSLLLVGLLHAAGDATASGSMGVGFLPRLYENADATLLQIGANVALGLVVIAATRARLGFGAGPELRTELGVSPNVARVP